MVKMVFIVLDIVGYCFVMVLVTSGGLLMVAAFLSFTFSSGGVVPLKSLATRKGALAAKMMYVFMG